jgi:myo-inositol 2-dehydrogenase/D-chiro-inositol 1-dehydrogenase
MINLAVFGAGRIGAVHALNAASHAGVRLKYLVDPVSTEQRGELAAKTGATIVDDKTVFRDADIAGVVIASSTDTHAELVLEAVARERRSSARSRSA